MNGMMWVMVALLVGWFLGVLTKRTEVNELREQYNNRHRLDEREIELANQRIDELEHELMVKQNVIKSLDEKVGRLQKIVKRVKQK